VKQRAPLPESVRVHIRLKNRLWKKYLRGEFVFGPPLTLPCPGGKLPQTTLFAVIPEPLGIVGAPWRLFLDINGYKMALSDHV